MSILFRQRFLRVFVVTEEAIPRVSFPALASSQADGGTHWSRSGDNRCLEFTFAGAGADDAAGLPTLGGIEITFTHGAQVTTYFEVRFGMLRHTYLEEAAKAQLRLKYTQVGLILIYTLLGRRSGQAYRSFS